jgi:hypothetical protein
MYDAYMARYRAKYKKTRNPPTIEMPSVSSDEVAFEEKDNKKTIEMKKIDKKDAGSKEKDDSLAPLLLGFGMIAVVGFALWAVSRRSPSSALFTQGPGMQQHISTGPTTLAGLPINRFTPTPLNSPAAPTWAKTQRPQFEIPDGSQTPQSNTRTPQLGSGQTTQTQTNAPDKVSIVIVFDSENPSRGNEIQDVISTWLGSNSVQGSQALIARSTDLNSLRTNLNEEFAEWNTASPRTRFIIGDVNGTGEGRKIDFYYVDGNSQSLQGPSSVTIGNRTDWQAIMNTYLGDLVRTRIIPGR